MRNYKKLLEAKIDAILDALRKFNLKFYHKKLQIFFKDIDLRATEKKPWFDIDDPKVFGVSNKDWKHQEDKWDKLRDLCHKLEWVRLNEKKEKPEDYCKEQGLDL